MTEGQQVSPEVAGEGSQEKTESADADGSGNEVIRQTPGAEHRLLEHFCGHGRPE